MIVGKDYVETYIEHVYVGVVQVEKGKGGQKGDKNWRKHVRARYLLRFSTSFQYNKYE